ncbi:type II toxin-antitoxin system VapC family toxin [Halapricum desulfuricans]|nr:type II toxin-antitoxin system VapC family toxin [Halapricum desulfuricans]
MTRTETEMLYLDNSVLRKATDDPPDPAVAAYLRANSGDSWAIPATVAWEYLDFFDSRSRRRRERQYLERAFQEVAPLTLDIAEEAAELSRLLAKQGVSLDAADLLHAATARANSGIFVTADAADFDKPEIHQLVDVDVIGVTNT